MQGMADEEYLPLKVVNELLCRQILNSNSLHFEDISDVNDSFLFKRYMLSTGL